jgi:lathosterol oxidase
MDLALDALDPLLFDWLYSPIPSFVARDYWLRQYLTILTLWLVGGYFLYLSIAGLSWFFMFDKSLRKHSKFLPNQELLEIGVALKSIPLMALPSAFIFLAEVRGYSFLYDGLELTLPTFLYNSFIILFYLFFTDTLIYWIHRWLHLPIFYGPIHKLHHKWIISTPFAR